MDNKHFIWIVPMLLIIGFVVGYVSGLNIPKEITIGLSENSLKTLNKGFDIQEKQIDNNNLLLQECLKINDVRSMNVSNEREYNLINYIYQDCMNKVNSGED